MQNGVLLKNIGQKIISNSNDNLKNNGRKI